MKALNASAAEAYSMYISIFDTECLCQLGKPEESHYDYHNTDPKRVSHRSGDGICEIFCLVIRYTSAGRRLGCLDFMGTDNPISCVTMCVFLLVLVISQISKWLRK